MVKLIFEELGRVAFLRRMLSLVVGENWKFLLLLTLHDCVAPPGGPYQSENAAAAGHLHVITHLLACSTL